jgi:peptidoglycan/LPS O-acetylase OafA/YrhL
VHQKAGRLFYIDFIRAVSLLIILQCHFDAAVVAANRGSATVFKAEYKNFDTGSLGVALFVMASGASLMISYAGKLDLRDFYYRRFLSIFPMFWTAWVAAEMFNIVADGHLRGSGVWWTPILTVIGFDGFLFYAIQNYYIVGEWFIGMILCLYLVFPFLRLALNKSPAATFCGTLVFVGLLHHFYDAMFQMPEFRNPLIQVAWLVLGMMSVRLFGMMGRKSAVLAVVTLIIVGNVTIKWPYIFTVMLVSAIAFGALALIGEHFPFGQVVRSQISAIAKYSYPAFLVHHVLVNWLTSLHPTSVFGEFEVWWVFAVAVAMALAGGYAISVAANRFVLPYFPNPARMAVGSYASRPAVIPAQRG